ncbi:TonB-dependent receptor [Methylobacillus rhizosphaerae]|nr:TonB-dependent receptor [Methylobacillus rhizosphaerae]
MANDELDQHWSAALNVYNLTNEKYFNSPMWGQRYYSAPMNASATLP